MALLDFERFGITADDVESCKYSYIIGFDLGDGEISAAYWDLKSPGFNKPVDLKFDINENLKLLSGFFIDDKGNVQMGTVATMGSLREAKGGLYTNFKIPPHRLKAGEKYENSDKTNLELMQMLLREALKRIHDIALKDKFYFEGKQKKGILAIGCPSSPEWTSAGIDVEYANMLKLALMECPLDLKIVIMPESRASLVKVYKEKTALKDQIKNGVIVIDHGSSTLDITAIDFKENTQYDFSIPLGANLIERKILRNAVTEYGRRESDIKGGKSGVIFQRLDVRGAKEGCYSNPSGVYKIYIDYCDDDDQRIKITNESMRNITHNDNVSYSTVETGTVTGSWAELHKQFILDCLSKAGENFNPKDFNGVVILTGGASKMQFIEETILDIFNFSSPKDSLFVDPEPSYCVSRGLAWATYTDLMALKLIGEVKLKITDAVQADFPSLKSLISKQLSPIIYSYAKDKLSEWAETGDNESVSIFVSRIEKEFLDTSTMEGKKRYNVVSEAMRNAITEHLKNSSNSGIRSMIIKIVNDVFSTTFPGRIDGKNIHQFTISDEEWKSVISKITSDDYKFGASIQNVMDLESIIGACLKFVIAIGLIAIAIALKILSLGMMDIDSFLQNFSTLFVENRILSKSDRQKVFRRVSEKKEEAISKIEEQIKNSNTSNDLREDISRQILHILDPVIDKAVNQVSIYF